MGAVFFRVGLTGNGIRAAFVKGRSDAKDGLLSLLTQRQTFIHCSEMLRMVLKGRPRRLESRRPNP